MAPARQPMASARFFPAPPDAERPCGIPESGQLRHACLRVVSRAGQGLPFRVHAGNTQAARR
eukprot:6350410-Pyramimonas_sp.AAC.1